MKVLESQGWKEEEHTAVLHWEPRQKGKERKIWGQDQGQLGVFPWMRHSTEGGWSQKNGYKVLGL